MPSRILEIIREKVRLLNEQPPKPQQQENQQTKKQLSSAQLLSLNYVQAKPKQLTLERKSENNLKKKK